MNNLRIFLRIAAFSAIVGVCFYPSVFHVKQSKSTEVSGTRLKAAHMMGSDGSKQLWGWQDSKLKEECVFVVLTDDSLRCVPSHEGYIVGVYSDAACTQDLAITRQGETAPSYAFSADSRAFRIFLITSSFVPPSGTEVYLKEDGNCEAYPADDLLERYAAYVVGNELPPTTFVDGKVEIDP